MRGIGLVGLALVFSVGCSRGPSTPELESMVDARIAARMASIAASASASNAPPKLSPEEQSSLFVARLEEVMRTYQPELRDTNGSADTFRCVTSEAVGQDDRLAKLRPIIKGRLSPEEAAMEAHVADPTAFRIDPDWKTRMGKATPAEYGCFNATYNRWTNIASPEFCAHNPYSNQADFVWKARVPARDAAYTYSGTKTPPTKPPELMRRLEAQAVALPERVFCRVADVVLKKDVRTVVCKTGPAPLRLRLAGGAPINAGDLVSVPVAGVHRDPDGVVFKDRDGWTIDADGAALKVENRASCPSADEVAAAASSVRGGAGR